MPYEVKWIVETSRVEEQRVRFEKARRMKGEVDCIIANEKEVSARFVAEKNIIAESERCVYLEHEEKAKIEADNITMGDVAVGYRINLDSMMIEKREVTRITESEEEKGAITESDGLKDIIPRAETKEEVERRGKNRVIRVIRENRLWLTERKDTQKAETVCVALRSTSDLHLREKDVRLINEKAVHSRRTIGVREAREIALAIEKERKIADEVLKREAAALSRRILIEGEKKKLKMENERVARGLSERNTRDELERVMRAESARAKTVENARRSAVLTELKARNSLEKRKDETRRRLSYTKYKENSETVLAERERKQQEDIKLNIEKDNARLAWIECNKRRS